MYIRAIRVVSIVSPCPLSRWSLSHLGHRLSFHSGCLGAGSDSHLDLLFFTSALLPTALPTPRTASLLSTRPSSSPLLYKQVLRTMCLVFVLLQLRLLHHLSIDAHRMISLCWIVRRRVYPCLVRVPTRGTLASHAPSPSGLRREECPSSRRTRRRRSPRWPRLTPIPSYARARVCGIHRVRRYAQQLCMLSQVATHRGATLRRPHPVVACLPHPTSPSPLPLCDHVRRDPLTPPACTARSCGRCV